VKPAIIIVDMVKDNFLDEHQLPITQEAKELIPRINHLLTKGREMGMPIIFACDSFLSEDFIFKGKMKPHSLRGTEGAEVIDELERKREDTVLPKRRFSAFFKTDLDQTLRTWGVDTVAIGGITTNVCVLITAMDAICHDYASIILDDCSAAHKREVHETTLDIYKKSALYPLFRTMTSLEFLKEAEEDK